jgi:hypothetical protein
VLFKYNENDQVGEDERAGHATQMGEKKNVYMLLVGKPEGRLLGRPRSSWMDDIEMDLGEIGWGGVTRLV